MKNADPDPDPDPDFDFDFDKTGSDARGATTFF